MSHERKRKYSVCWLSSLCLLLALFLTLTGASFAWFVNMLQPAPKEDFYASSVAAYFADGDGLTRETPYLITEPVHLYNLAWLQYLGVFNQVDAEGNIKQQYYFRLENDIDMNGLILPPIGTTEYPFVGNFNGNQKVITGATVSNYLADTAGDGGIEQAPASVESYDNTVKVGNTTEQGAIVGFFGVIGNWDGSIKGLAVEDAGVTDVTQKTNAVYNFFLDDLTVRSDTTQSLMGLLAGYVDGSMANVGIGGSQLLVGENVKALNITDSPFEMQKMVSEYSLIGLYDGATVEWIDKPTDSGDGSGSGGEGEGGGAGGEIIVDPNDVTLVGADGGARVQFAALSSNQYQAVANTIAGTAYYVGTLETKARPNGNMSLWDMTNGNAQSFTADTDEKQAISKAYDWYESNSAYLIAPKLAPSLNNLVSVSYQENNVTKTVDVPANSVWFKPQQAGTAALAFTKFNNSDAYSMSVYKYQRNKETQALTQVSETKCTMPKSVKNGHVAYFEYEVELAPKDAEYVYEYAIGAPSEGNSSQNAGFFMMVLAGTNVEGGDQGGGETTPVHRLSGINFVDAALLSSDDRDISTYPTVTLSLTVNNDTHAPVTMAYARVSMASMTYQLGGEGAASCSVSSFISEGVTVSTSTSLITAQLRAIPPRKEEYTLL